MEERFGQSKLIDIPFMVSQCRDKWMNMTLSQVNNCVVRLGVVEGEFHWHQHENEDEFFFVVEGNLYIDLENETIELSQSQGYTVPKGAIHRTRSAQRTVILMVEQDTVKPKGD